VFEGWRGGGGKSGCGCGGVVGWGGCFIKDELKR
jgi:hypothetical protein